MARASTYTLLSLDRFSQLLGMNPLHFNQVVVENRNVDSGWSCGTSVSQYGWQAAGRVGREEIAIAIAQAEAAIAQVLGYDVAPRWHVQDLASIIKPADPRTWFQELFHQTVKLPRGQVLYGGMETRTSLAATATVTYDTQYGSAYQERATVACTVPAGTAPGDICLYYPGKDMSDAWEIRPIEVSVSGTTVTIRCRREQCVVPNIQEDALSWDEVDGLDNANFIGSAEVALRTNDPSRMLDVIWEPLEPLFNIFGVRVCALCDDEGSGCPACTETVRSACFTVRDRRLGTVNFQLGTWDSVAGSYTIATNPLPFSHMPNKCLAYYRAGKYDPDLARPLWSISPSLERAVFMLAMTNLARPICGCEDIKDLHGYYNTDFAEVSSDPSGSLSYQGTALESNPFSTKRGAIEAFKILRQGLALGGGVNVYGR